MLTESSHIFTFHMKRMCQTLKHSWKSILRYIKRYSVFIFTLVSFVPLIAFICEFGGNGISDDLDDWSKFGDYIGGVYSIIIAILAIFLARTLDKKDRRQIKQQQIMSDLYDQITNMQNCPRHKLVYSVNKFFRVVEKHRLFLTENQTLKMQGVGDYFLKVASDTIDRDAEYERDFKDYLFALYHNV